MNSVTLVRRIGRWHLIREFVWGVIGRRAGRRRIAKQYPVLAAIPADSIGREIFLNGLYEEDLLLAIFDVVLARSKDHFRAQIALDVGANVGNHSLFFAQRFRKVVSFEPNPPVALILEANVLLNGASNVQVIKCGLSDHESDAPFRVADVQNLGGGRFTNDLEHDNVGGTLLPLRVGDRELEKLGIRDGIALIKLDVEGHELSALKGLESTLRSQRPILLFESNSTAGRGGGAEIIEWIRGVGYQHVYSVGRRWSLQSGAAARYGRLIGLVDLVTALIRGGDYSLEEVDHLDERIYPLLLATELPL